MAETRSKEAPVSYSKSRAGRSASPLRQSPKAGKHIAAPATVSEISRSVGVTAKDARLVRKVLRSLGYATE